MLRGDSPRHDCHVSSGKKPPLAQVFVILFAAYSGLYASRGLPISSLLLTLVIAPLLTQAVSEGPTNAALSLKAANILFEMGSVWVAHAEHGAEFSGHMWPVVVMAFGLFACCARGQVGFLRVDGGAFSAENFPVRPAK